MPKREWYFVSHRIRGDSSNQALPFEVQVLDLHGRAKSVGYFDAGCESLVIRGKPIPQAVIEATKKYPVGFGDYVDNTGIRLDMWGNPLPGSHETDREKLAAMLVEGAIRIMTMRSPNVPRGIERLRAVVEHYGETQAAQEARTLLKAHGLEA